MNNEEKILTVLERMDARMDKMESGLTGLNTRMDKMESGLTGLNTRMDKMESGLTGLNSRMNKMESGLTGLNSRIDELESNMSLEFYAVRTEMDVVNKSLKKEIDILSSKVDRLMFTKDVEGYDKIDARLMVLEEGYRELKEKIV